jgi:hypothetical protein
MRVLTKTRVVVLTIIAIGLPTLTYLSPVAFGKPGEVRLRARGEHVINGIEAELRGDFRNLLTRLRLQGELENINLPLGTHITFCVQPGNMRLAVAKVELEEQQKVAEFELDTNDGDTFPNVVAGDVLQARQGTTCAAPLLVSATFKPKS